MTTTIELTCDRDAFHAVHRVAEVQRGKIGTIDKEALRRLLVDHHRLLEFTKRQDVALKGKGWW